LTITEVNGAGATVPVDISLASTLNVLLRKPDGSTLIEDAALASGGTDGILQFIDTIGIIDQPGRWLYEAYVELSDGKWYTESASFMADSPIVAVA
jgi:hypothetical protein